MRKRETSCQDWRVASLFTFSLSVLHSLHLRLLLSFLITARWQSHDFSLLLFYFLFPRAPFMCICDNRWVFCSLFHSPLRPDPYLESLSWPTKNDLRSPASFSLSFPVLIQQNPHERQWQSLHLSSGHFRSHFTPTVCFLDGLQFIFMGPDF